jgi:cysteine desulfurase
VPTVPLIYLDYQATTPVDDRVLDAMLPYLRDQFGNSASVQHAFGRQAEKAVTRARRQVAELLGGRPGEIVFCSGATEANNLAITAVAGGTEERRTRIVSCAIEHAAVLHPLAALAADGWDVVLLDVDGEGHIDMRQVIDAINDETALVSIAAACRRSSPSG